jgi:hypothetical protein
MTASKEKREGTHGKKKNYDTRKKQRGGVNLVSPPSTRRSRYIHFVLARAFIGKF